MHHISVELQGILDFASITAYYIKFLPFFKEEKAYIFKKQQKLNASTPAYGGIYDHIAL